MNAVPLSAALLAIQQARVDAVDARQQLDAVFNLLRPGFVPPPEETDRLHKEVFELLAKYFKLVIPTGGVDVAVLPALFYSAASFAFASSAESLARSAESEIIKLLGDAKGRSRQ